MKPTLFLPRLGYVGRHMRFAIVSACGVGVLIALAAAACKSPTQILLDVRTNADCTSALAWRGVVVYVGAPGVDVETRAPTLSTGACNAGGEIGTLVVTPSGAHDGEVGLRVVAGLTTNPEDCAAKGYAGCIVSRRAVRFRPGQTVNVAVGLTVDCTGVACNSSRTCVNGVCVDAREDNVDIAATNPDSGVSGGGPTTATPVRCGDDGLHCAKSGDVCCLHADLDAGTSTGKCMPSTACPTSDAVFLCDDSSQCDAPGGDAGTAVCCAIARSPSACQFNGDTIAGAQCVPLDACQGKGAGIVLCQSRKPCADGNICAPTGGLLFAGGGSPGYFACCL